MIKVTLTTTMGAITTVIQKSDLSRFKEAVRRGFEQTGLIEFKDVPQIILNSKYFVSVVYEEVAER